MGSRQAGLPVSINKTRTAAGETQQWVYGLGDYVYLARMPC
jgi:hypothetical protein